MHVSEVKFNCSERKLAVMDDPVAAFDKGLTAVD